MYSYISGVYLYGKDHGFIEYRLKTLRSYDTTHRLRQRERERVVAAPTKPLTEHHSNVRLEAQ